MTKSIYDKLAKALAYRKYSFNEHCVVHEYVIGSAEGEESFKDCKFYSELYFGLSDQDIETLLNDAPVI